MEKLYQVVYDIAMTNAVQKIKSRLKKHTKLAFDLGLVWGTSGNMSMRAGTDGFFITATGKSLGDISGKDLVLCRITKEQADRKASMEWRLHKEIYHSRRDANAVFHSQPTYSTVIACAKDNRVKTALIPETIAYLGHIEVIPYCHAGSVELAKKCGGGAKRADVLLLENHGVVTFGPCIEVAVNKALTFEFLCRLTVLSKAGGIELKAINPRKANEFLSLLGARERV